MNAGMYNKIGRDIIAHYKKLYNDADPNELKELRQVFNSMGVRISSNGNVEWSPDYAMSQGRFYKLPEEIKKEIIKKTNGEIEIVEGADGYDVIQPKGTARPFVPISQVEEDEEEELMGN